MKKGRVANFHGQASDAYACAVDRGFDQRSDQTKNYTIYIGTWHKRIKAETSQHNFFITWDRSREVFHEYKLPCICPVYDIGFKVLSMKINYHLKQTNLYV
jgi:hypothetical protein